MRAALDEAKKALTVGEVPVGCVLVHNKDLLVVSSGHNETNLSCNATRHAELVALDRVIQEGPELLKECDLFVTCEPCIMCAAALGEVQIRRVVFGCKNDRFGGCGSILSINDCSLPIAHHQYPCKSGVLADEAVSLFKTFYARENARAPEPKRRKRQDEKEGKSSARSSA
ncbi:unnamed protein product [Discosporangium mesarthrocarpum]